MRDLATMLEFATKVGTLEPDEPQHRCQDCRDSGFVMSRDEQGVAMAKRCPCAFKRTAGEVRAVLSSSGMAQGEIDMAWRKWDDGHQAPPTFAREWLAWAMSGSRPEDMPPGITADGRAPAEPWILTLFGDPGRGKTMTAARVAKVFVRDGGRALVWANASEAFDKVQAERYEGGSSGWERRIIDAGLLVLDDFGRDHRVGEVLERTVGNWLYQRFRHQRPTVVPTNFKTFAALRDSAIGSRLAAGIYREMAAPTDYRDKG